MARGGADGECFLTKTTRKGQTVNKGGRPEAIAPNATTIKTMIGLGKIQATTRECAAVMGVSHQTMIAAMQKHPEIAAALERGKEQGRVSLRRTQFRMAEKNASMAIFLGKNYLDQTDRQDITANVTQDVTISDARSKLELLIDRQSATAAASGVNSKPH